MLRPKIIEKIRREVSEINQGSHLTGIFAEMGEDVNNLKALIVGPMDSPYTGGFFYFDINFPSNYPFSPPKITFLTPVRDLNCRLHPNLYAEGKVCLSILNTWGHNEWSPALSLEKIFITIQGLLDNNPLTFEPGHENVKSSNKDAQSYTQVAIYRCLTTAVIGMLKREDLSDNFKTIIRERFEYYRSSYLESLEKLKEVSDMNIRCFHGSEKINYLKLKSQLIDINT